MRDCEGKVATTSQTIKCMTVIRADRRDQWIPPIDAEVFNEQMHLNALSDILVQDAKVELFKKFTNKQNTEAEA